MTGEQPSTIWDVLVLGAGPAGLTAGAFLARHGRRVTVIDNFLGNHMMNAGVVENFPGFPDGIEGPELASYLQRQSMAAGAEFLAANVESIEVSERGTPLFAVTTDAGTRVAHSIVSCTGSRPRRLGFEDEARLFGKGVSTCATCDGPLFGGRRVAVAGGGDSALDEALLLSEVASEVVVIHQEQALTGQRALIDRAQRTPNIRMHPSAGIVGLKGDDRLEGVIIRGLDGVESTLDVGALFVFIGLQPNTEFLRNIVDLDETGRVVTDGSMRASIPGLFAAGDCRTGSVAQFVTAAGDGATAAIEAHRYLTR